MVVGDGMGPAYTTAYRYFSDNPETDLIEETVFDRHLVGMASTYPARVSGYVTDSAAAATALATGVKSYNGAIGLDVNKKSVESVLEWAKKQGKKTGVVVTSQVNHATPASYLAHNESRRNYNAIADSYIHKAISNKGSQIVLVHHLLGDCRDWDSHVFGSMKGILMVEVEILDVKAAEFAILCGENTIEEDLCCNY